MAAGAQLPLARAGLQVFPLADAAAVATSVAERVAQLLRQAIADRGQASLAVSGGRSPVAFFHALRQLPLAWDKVVVTLADERWVSPDSIDSNERLVRENLLLGPPAAARFVGLKSDAATPAAAVAERTLALESLPLPLDVVVLGLGEDGHTASLFPGASGLAAALVPDSGPLLAAIEPSLAAHPRLSLTLRGILASRQLILPVTGEAKRSVLARAATEADASTLPIAAILAQRLVPLDIYNAP